MRDKPGLRKVIADLSMEAASQAFESSNTSQRLASLPNEEKLTADYTDFTDSEQNNFVLLL
jgi:hypothetical protein